MIMAPRTRLLPLLASVAMLSACSAAGTGPAATRYRCEHGVDFSVRFVDDSALIGGPRDSEVLFRDAGGQGPAQPVYSNTRMRAEFGLGPGGREAVLHYPLLPLTVRCVRD